MNGKRIVGSVGWAAVLAWLLGGQITPPLISGGERSDRETRPAQLYVRLLGTSA